MGVKFLDKKAILQSQDIQIREVFIPEWGGIVRIKTLNAIERGKIGRILYENKDNPIFSENFRSIFVSFALCDERGNRIFSDSNSDIEALNKKSSAAIFKIYEIIKNMTNVGQEGVEGSGKILTGSELKS